jgi:hypothetical protein
VVETRNPRSVWTIPPEPIKERHFTPFPSELPYRCIKAATSDAGCCPACGAQYVPLVNRERVPTRPGRQTKATGDRMTDGNRDRKRHVVRKAVLDYLPTCDCRAGEPVPCTVLDPFAGSGTTLQTAVWSGRRAIGCEAQEEYLGVIRRRIGQRPRAVRAEKDPKRTQLNPIEPH